MIVSDRMTTFINSLDPGNPEYLDRLEEEAIADFVPIISHSCMTRSVSSNYCKAGFYDMSVLQYIVRYTSSSLG